MHLPPPHGADRREHSRTALQSFVYLNLGETYYGSVLNISEGGLCFRTVRPIAETGSFTFSIFEGRHRVDATGELVWKDETQKTGGLRFTGLTPVVTRELIEHWVGQPKAAGALTATSSAFPTLGGLSRKKSNHAQSELTLGHWLRASGPLSHLRLPLPARGFSSGLITGFLVSGLLACTLLFNHYRSQFGGLLVRWGQHLMGQSQDNGVTLPRPSRTELVPQGNTNKHSLRTETSEPKLQNQKLTAEAEGQPGTEPIVVKRGLRSSHSSFALPAPNAPLTPSLTAVPLFLQRSPTSIPSSGTNAIEAYTTLDGPAHTILGSGTSEQRSASSISEMYLEVGKFKDQQQAVDTVGQLGRWGFPATTVQKGGIWTSAYHVLVGPYSSAQQFKAARKSLTQRGLQPKTFEKGSRSLTILSNLMLNGALLPSGDYTISWESYVDEASVRFVRDHSVVTTAEGKWVKRSATYNSDAYVYRKSGDDSKNLVQILFRNMSKALDFRE